MIAIYHYFLAYIILMMFGNESSAYVCGDNGRLW